MDVIQFPNGDNGSEAICKAIVCSSGGDEYIEFGDANPGNVAPMIACHILRMAATRAKARALRDFTNIGMTCLEELGDLGALPGNGFGGPAGGNGSGSNAGSSKPKQKKPPAKKKSGKMTKAQKEAIINIGNRQGIAVGDLDNMAIEAFGSKLDILTSADASAFIRQLQAA